MQNYQSILKEKKKVRERILEYSGSVKDDFKPKIDIKKKEEVERTIKLLEEQSEKGKKRIINKDGSISFEVISPEKKRKVGLSYLENLKKYNEGKKRK